MTVAAVTVSVVLVAGLVVAGCDDEDPGTVRGGGRPERGHDLIVRYGCGACHRIGGVENANGRVGPSLTGFGSKKYIAGRLPNSPRNVVRWILDPRGFEPDTVMPDLGLSRREARDVASYLYTQ